jgi:hypothetical protein
MTLTERAKLGEAVGEDVEILVFPYFSPPFHHERQICQSEKSCGVPRGIRPLGSFLGYFLGKAKK